MFVLFVELILQRATKKPKGLLYSHETSLCIKKNSDAFPDSENKLRRVQESELSIC